MADDFTLAPNADVVTQQKKAEQEAADRAAGTPKDIVSEILSAQPITAKREEEISVKHFRRILNGVNGTTDDKVPLTPDEAAIKTAYEKELAANIAAQQERSKAAGSVVLPEPLDQRQRAALGRHLNIQYTQNRGLWKQMTDSEIATMLQYRRDNREDWRHIYDEYNPNGSGWSQFGHGVLGMAKSIKLPVIGRSTSQILGHTNAMQDILSEDEKRLNNNLAVQTEWWRVLAKFKADPKSRRKEIVDDLLSQITKNKELLVEKNWDKFPEFKAKMETLNDVEKVDLMLALNHSRDPMPAKGEDKKERPWWNPFTADRFVRLDDFNLDAVQGDWPKDLADKLEAPAAIEYGTALGGTPLSEDPRGNFQDRYNRQVQFELLKDADGKALLDANGRSQTTGIDPLLFAVDKVGQGIFGRGQSFNDFYAKFYAAQMYQRSSLGTAEGVLNMAYTMGAGIAGNAVDPTEELSWSNVFTEGEVGAIKNALHNWGTGTITDMPKLVEIFKAAQTTQDNIEAAMRGERSLIAGPALAMLTSMNLDEAQKVLRKYGALNAEALNTGMYRYGPSAIAGRASVIGKAGMGGGMGVIGALSKGVQMTRAIAPKMVTLRSVVKINNRLMKIGSGIEWLEQKTFGAPVKIVGTVVGGTGRAVLYGVGKAGALIASGLEKVGIQMSATKALGMLGVTSSFANFTIGQRLLGLYGFGVAANDVGFFLNRFGYKGVNANGYGFAKAMEEASLAWQKGPVAGSLFEGATNLTAFGARVAGMMGKYSCITIPVHDFIKGAWHGAGVGYGLGFLQDGHRAGVAGVWGGAGMGGFGGAHASYQQHRLGIYAHAQTKNELLKLVENDPTQLELIKEQIANAESRQDWNAIPLMLGAAKYAAEHGFRVTMHRNGDISHIDNNIFDVDSLTDAELTVGNKTHDLRSKRDAWNISTRTELILQERLRLDDAEPDPAKKLSDKDRAALLDQAAKVSQATESLSADYNSAIKEYLNDVKLNGDEALRTKLAADHNHYEGVYVSGKAGSGVIFVNVDRASNTTTAHELFHGIQTAINIHSAKAHFVNQVFGISSETVIETDAAGKLISKGILTVQKGGASIDVLKDFANLYVDTLYAGEGRQGIRDRKKAQILDAVDALNKQGLTLDAIETAKAVLTNYAEEFGAYYFESFLRRNKADYLYRKGKYGAFDRMITQVENYIDHKTKLDLNGQGIHENLLRIQNERGSKDAKRMLILLKRTGRQIMEQSKKLEDLAEKEANGDIKRDKDGNVVWKVKKVMKDGKEVLVSMKDRAETMKEGLAQLHKQRLDILDSVKKNAIGSTFVTKDGTFLILPQAEEAIKRIIENKPKSLEANPFDLSSLPRGELTSILTRAGLEHWVDQNGNLKPREVIEKETADRGKKSIEMVEQLGPKVTGVVVHTDANGNKRGIGILTDEGIKALRDAGLITPSELIKITSLRNIIRGVVGIDPLGGGEINFLYNALSGEYYDNNGGVGRNRKPKNEVAPTYRRVLPYKMEMVLTSKDRNGNTIPPRYEMMITGIDMGVILDRAAHEFSQSYQIGDTGRSIRVADEFGNNFALFRQAINMYLTGLTEGRMPSADLFGGGERGAAIRDVMLRVIGPSPERSFRADGTPMFDNNPIIRPFSTWERGPNFAFTTFRVDLMQDIEAIHHTGVRFNETTGYANLIKNFSPVQYTEPKPLRGRLSFTATADYEWIHRRKEGIIITKTANYTVTQTKDGKFQVGSEEFKKPIIVSDEKAARDFIELDVQRREYIGKNIIAAHLHGGDAGVLAVGHNGKYILVDSKNKYQPVEGRVYGDEISAVTAAAKIHNDGLLAKLRGKSGQRDRVLVESLIQQAIDANSANPEMLPQRLAIGKDGLPKLKIVRDSEGKEVKYTANDEEVKRGLAVPNQTKKIVEFQKASYGLLESMVGNSSLRMMDLSVQGAAERVAEELVKEAREAVKDPAKRKGINWYRQMVKDGYSIFGSVYGMFSELEGATSARTPVAENFKQAMEALAMFSNNKYQSQLAEIDRAIKDIEARAEQKDELGRSIFEAEAVDILHKKAAAKEANERFNEDLDWYEWDDPASVAREIDADALAGFREAYLNIKKNSKKVSLTPAQLSDALQGAKAKVFKDKGSLMLRSNGKKFNANTVKVGQVMYGLWREMTEGPKTPNFASNLSGLSRNATIDVWAARSLHRIINNKINGRQKWRLSAGMETGVDYVWYPQGDNFNPVWEGGGDFFFGQKIFELAAENLRKEGGDFADIMPDDLQALMWFHEKGIWAEKGWTDSVGAEFSSFEGPTQAISGVRDATGINEWNNIRRFIVGVSGSYSAYGINIPLNGKIVAQSSIARNFAAPQHRVLEWKGAVADQLGPIGQNSGQSVGYYGGQLEHSLFFDVLLQRGKTQDLAIQSAKSDSELVKAQNRVDGLRAKMRDGNTPSGERGKIEKSLKKAEAALEKVKQSRESNKAEYEKESNNPTIKNQLGLLLEHMVTVAKNYNQSDVMVGEVVGKDHPNARPAIEVNFGREKPVDMQTALDITKRLIASGNNFLTGFTLIPDPRNGANKRLSELTKRLAEITDADGNPTKGNEEQFKSLTNESNSLTKFIGIRAEANPEMTARFAHFSEVPEIKSGQRKLLSEADARWYMGEWQKAVATATSQITEHNGIRLQPREYYISTETVPRGSYDSYNPAEIGREVSLAERLHRYRVGLERESALADEFRQTGELFPSESSVLKDNRTTWAATPADREAGSKIDPSLDAYEQGKTASRVSGNIRLTPDAADSWVGKAFAAPIIKSDGGVVWGNKDFTVTQRRLGDGSLSNTYEIRGAYDRRPTIVTGLENAKIALKQRLTGDLGAAAGERSIEVNGEKFTIHEATALGITAEGEASNPAAGRYDKESNIFKYKPDDVPEIQKHPYNSKGFRDVFTAQSGPITEFYSHRAEKVQARLNALLTRLGVNSRWQVQFRIDNVNDTSNSDFEWNSGRTSVVIVTNNGNFPIRIGHQSWDVTKVALDPNSTYHGKRPLASQPTHASGDEGNIGSANVLGGAMTPWYNALQVLKKSGVWTNIGEELQIAIEDRKQSKTPYNITNLLEDVLVQLRQDIVMQKVSFDKGIKPEEVREAASEFIYKMADANLLDIFQTRLNADLDAAKIEDIITNFQNIGYALNAELGGRLYATGMLPKGTKGLGSQVVNREGAVIKTRTKTFGEHQHRFEMDDGQTMSNAQEAIRLNTEGDMGLQMTTWTPTDPTHKFSPSDIPSFLQKSKAFNEEATKGDGSLFSKYAEHNLPKNAAIAFSVDSAGNIKVTAKNKDTDNTVMSFTILSPKDKKSVEVGNAFLAETPESIAKKRESKWYKEEVDSEGVLRNYKSGRPIIIDELAGSPDLKVSMVRETIERLRQSGFKRMFYDSFDSHNIESVIREAFEKDPELSQKGWEGEDSGWNIDQKKAYSPSSDKFLGLERAFQDHDINAKNGGLFSSRARDILGPDIQLHFSVSTPYGWNERSVFVVATHKGEDLISFNLFPTSASNGTLLGKAEIKGIFENTGYSRDLTNGVGDMKKVYSGIFTEMVERLRQTGHRIVSVNEETLRPEIAGEVKGAMVDVFGHNPNGRVSSYGQMSGPDGNAKQLVGDLLAGLQGKASGPNDAWAINRKKAYKPEDYASFKEWEDNWVQKGGGSFGEIFAAWKHFTTSGGLYSPYDVNFERRVGTKSISLPDLMKLVNHKSINWAEATPQEQLMFDLLGLLDSFSGLGKESNAKVIMDEPHQRSHSTGAAEKRISTDSHYYFKTTGDITTLIEEIHHSLFGADREGMIRDDYNELGIGDGYPTLNENTIKKDGTRIPTWEGGLTAGQVRAPVPSADWIAQMREANKKNLEDTLANNLDPKKAMRRAAFYTLIESWLRVFENTPADMIKSMATTRVGKAAMKSNPDITAAELAFGTQPVAVRKNKVVGRYPNRRNVWFTERDAANKLRIGSPRDKSFADPSDSAYSDDYHLPTLVEFAAGVLNDSKIQALLSRLPKIEGDAIDTVLDHYEKSQNADHRGWAGKVRSAWASAKTMFNQVLASIRTLAWYNSEYIREKEEARSKVDPLASAADDLRTNQKKDTLLDSAIRAAIMIHPRGTGTEVFSEGSGSSLVNRTRAGIKDPRTTRVDSDTSLILANAATHIKLRAESAANRPQAEAAEAATAKGISEKVSFVKGLSDQIKNPPVRTGAFVTRKSPLSGRPIKEWDANVARPQTVRFVNPSAVLVNETLSAQSHTHDGGYSLTQHLRGRERKNGANTIEGLFPDLDSILPNVDPDKPFQHMRGDQERIDIKKTVNLIKQGNNEVASLYESVRESLRTGTKNNDIVPIPLSYTDSGNGWYELTIGAYKDAFNSSPAERRLAAQKLRAVLLAFHFHNLSVPASERVPLPIVMENKSNGRWAKTSGFEFTQGDTPFKE